MLKYVLTGFLTIFLVSAGLLADDLNISKIMEMSKADAEKEFSAVLDAVGTSLNTGIYAPVSGTVFSVGLQGNITPLPEEGLLKDADLSYIFLPWLYGGVRIPGFDINLFIRGMAFPYKEKTVTLFGLGGGWEPDLLPVVNTKMVIHYHILKNIFGVEGNSIGATIVMDMTVIPMITPFLTLGLNNISLSTPGISAAGSADVFIMDKVLFQSSIGVKLLKIAVLEFNYLPVPVYSLSLGYSF